MVMSMHTVKYTMCAEQDFQRIGIKLLTDKKCQNISLLDLRNRNLLI